MNMQNEVNKNEANCQQLKHIICGYKVNNTSKYTADVIQKLGQCCQLIDQCATSKVTSHINTNMNGCTVHKLNTAQTAVDDVMMC